MKRYLRSSRLGSWVLVLAVAVVALAAAQPCAAQGLPPGAYIAYSDTSNIYLSNGTEVGLLVPAVTIKTKGQGTVYANDMPSWSSDGSEICFFRDDPATGYGLYAIRSDGTGDLRKIANSNRIGSRPDWSKSMTPTGTQMILYDDKPPGAVSSEVFAVNPTGDDPPIRLTFDQKNVGWPVWSPDGNRFVVIDLDGAVIMDVGMVSGKLTVVGKTRISNISGSPLEGKGVGCADWSHDGNWIVLFDGVGLHRINVHNPLDVVFLFAVDKGWPRFSPDDSKIIFSMSGRGKRGTRQLHSINASDGSALTRLHDVKHAQRYAAVRHN